MPNIRKQCEMCGTSFDVPRYREQTARYCSRDCHADGQKGARSPRWKGGNNHRNYWLRTAYGIESSDYDAMLEAQDNCCAICGTTDPGGRHGQFHVDHDHETGEIRGLLCLRCNTGLGFFRDNPELLKTALQYLSNPRTITAVLPPQPSEKPMSYDKDTSVPGQKGAGAQQDADLRDAKAGSPKGASGTYSDRQEAPPQGPGRVSSNYINKPATPRPAGSTADINREKP